MESTIIIVIGNIYFSEVKGKSFQIRGVQEDGGMWKHLILLDKKVDLVVV